MFRSIIIFLALAVMAIATKDPNYCYEDGCKRTLQNNKPAGAAQCQDDLLCRVTPKAVIAAPRHTTSTGGVVTVTFSKITYIPSAAAATSSCATRPPPRYLAQSCEYNLASYTSACRCIGATGKVIPFPAPTVTPTITTVYPTAIATAYA